MDLRVPVGERLGHKLDAANAFDNLFAGCDVTGQLRVVLVQLKLDLDIFILVLTGNRPVLTGN